MSTSSTRSAPLRAHAKPQKPMSPARRKTLVTQQLMNALGDDQTAVITAALEIINERLAWDASLRQSARERYEELHALSAPKPQVTLKPLPVPINPPRLGEFNPYGKFDPYELAYEYGNDQLRAVLELGTQRDLREAVALVKQRQPGTKPASASRKSDMIDYVVEQVAGSGH